MRCLRMEMIFGCDWLSVVGFEFDEFLGIEGRA